MGSESSYFLEIISHTEDYHAIVSSSGVVSVKQNQK